MSAPDPRKEGLLIERLRVALNTPTDSNKNATKLEDGAPLAAILSEAVQAVRHIAVLDETLVTVCRQLEGVVQHEIDADARIAATRKPPQGGWASDRVATLGYTWRRAEWGFPIVVLELVYTESTGRVVTNAVISRHKTVKGAWRTVQDKGPFDSIHAAKEAAALRILAQHKGR